MLFHSFDEAYVRRLAEGDSAAGDHFASYFGDVLHLKLRVRLRSPELIEDVKQETLLRVLATLRHGEGVRRPERFGAFVNAVCNNVMRELCRLDRRYEPWDEFVDEPVDSSVDLDAPLIREDLKAKIGESMRELQERDRKILHAIFIEEADKNEVCRRFGIDAGYLRVLLHRAKAHFRQAYES